MLRFLRDKNHFMMAPIYVFLVEHPRHCTVLVDTGPERMRSAMDDPADAGERLPAGLG